MAKKRKKKRTVAQKAATKRMLAAGKALRTAGLMSYGGRFVKPITKKLKRIRRRKTIRPFPYDEQSKLFLKK